MVILNGFVKIHRKLLAWGWYQDYVVKDVFIHLLLTANFKEMQWQGTIVNPGQLITSYAHLAKAFYNADDFNRVETAVEYISKLLTDSGYFTTVTVKKDWTKSDIPSAKDMERFISNINKCVNNFTSAGYPIPSTLVGINFESANNIEKTLEGLQILVDNMKAAYRYVGTFYAGQMDGLRGYYL